MRNIRKNIKRLFAIGLRARSVEKHVPLDRIRKKRNALDSLGRDVRSKSILGVRERRENKGHDSIDVKRRVGVVIYDRTH